MALKLVDNVARTPISVNLLLKIFVVYDTVVMAVIFILFLVRSDEFSRMLGTDNVVIGFILMLLVGTYAWAMLISSYETRCETAKIREYLAELVDSERAKRQEGSSLPE
jgi:hypothetical protein